MSTSAIRATTPAVVGREEVVMTERLGPSAAHIRMVRGHLGTSVVTHEVAHAALGIYRQDCLARRGSVHDDMEQEETVCYLVGDLAARIVNRLYAYGCYGEGA